MGTVKNHFDQWQLVCQISFWVWIKTLGCGFTCPTKFLVEDPFYHQYLHSWYEKDIVKITCKFQINNEKYKENNIKVIA